MHKFLCLTLFSFMSFSTPASAQFFGEFPDRLSGYWNTGGGDDWNTFTLMDRFRFNDANGLTWTTPQNHTVNGASIPRWAWTVIGSPYSDRYLPASVIHDYYVFTKERLAHDTHRNFYYGMRANGVGKVKARVMYWAVSVYSDWDLDEQGNPTNIQFLTAETDEAFVSLQESVSEVAEQVAEQVMSEGLNVENQLGLAILSADASAYRDVLAGEMNPLLYSGFAAGFAPENGVFIASQPDLQHWSIDNPINLQDLDSGVPIEFEFRDPSDAWRDVIDFQVRDQFLSPEIDLGGSTIMLFDTPNDSIILRNDLTGSGFANQ